MELAWYKLKGGEWNCAMVKAASATQGSVVGSIGKIAVMAAAGATLSCSPLPIYGWALCCFGDWQQDWGDDISFEPH
jgi:hypothetical protein